MTTLLTQVFFFEEDRLKISMVFKAVLCAVNKILWETDRVRSVQSGNACEKCLGNPNKCKKLVEKLIVHL